MNITKNFWSKLACAGLALTLFSCGGESEPVIEEVAVVEDVTMDDDEDDDYVDFLMPSPLQIAAIFKNAGLEYDSEAINSPENVSKYNSQLSRALNFGVYAADLSYCVLNKQSQEAISYMKAVKTLSDDLGVTSMFGAANLFTSFEGNLENEDSLIYILATIQENLDEHLESNEQQYMSVVFFTGGWTEGMYIGSRTAKEGNPSISARLIEQMVILENMIGALQSYPHKSEFLDELIVDLQDIDETYKSFESLKDVDLDSVHSFDQLKVTPEELNAIVQKVEMLREKIING